MTTTSMATLAQAPRRVARGLLHAAPISLVRAACLRLRPKRFRAYCVGLPKTGTHSLAGLFATHFRSAHEVGNYRLLPLAIEHYQSLDLQPRIMRELLIKELVHELEMDSNVLNAYFVREISALFPDAKFILTVRDPKSWLSSIVNHMLSKETTDAWKQFRTTRFGPLPTHYPVQEVWLQSVGLPTIGALLDYWSAHNHRVVEQVPANRLLIVKTSEIGHSLKRIADFLQVDENLLDPRQSHSFKANYESALYEHVPLGYTMRLIARHCGDSALFAD